MFKLSVISHAILGLFHVEISMLARLHVKLLTPSDADFILLILWPPNIPDCRELRIFVQKRNKIIQLLTNAISKRKRN